MALAPPFACGEIPQTAPLIPGEPLQLHLCEVMVEGKVADSKAVAAHGSPVGPEQAGADGATETTGGSNSMVVEGLAVMTRAVMAESLRTELATDPPTGRRINPTLQTTQHRGVDQPRSP